MAGVSQFRGVSEYNGVSSRNGISSGLPSDISSLALWLDADAPETFTFSTGSDISAWADRSGNGNHATQGTGSLQPLYVTSGINGLPSVHFYDDSTGKMLSSPDATSMNYTAFSLFVVFQRVTDTGATERICGKFSTASPANQREFSANLNGDVFQIATSSNGTTADGLGNTTGTISVGTPIIGDGVFQPSPGTVRKNNDSASEVTGSVTNPIFNGTSPFHVGAQDGTAGPYAGYIGEILFYTKALSDSERAFILGYLSSKWRIAIS